NSNEGIIGVLKDCTLHARPVGISRIRVLASPAYLKRHGMPPSPTQLAQHSLLGFTQPESLNDWPLRDADGNAVRIRPDIASSSGETLRQMALAGLGIVCLSDFMTRTDREQGNLVQLLGKQTLDICQPVNAVYYRNTALAARITCFVDHVVETLGSRPFGT
ncbi:LysR substrate-binding domain-containing protein, partial [Comamonas thiooxydans]|uniref:LysR substrate-binding domain-containing protein n=1 Tax=Comamonas thiooxydans TaxID=363952 RepID=UPI001184BB6F